MFHQMFSRSRSAIRLYFSRPGNRRSRGQETPQEDGPGRPIAPQWSPCMDDLWPYRGLIHIFILDVFRLRGGHHVQVNVCAYPADRTGCGRGYRSGCCRGPGHDDGGKCPYGSGHRNSLMCTVRQRSTGGHLDRTTTNVPSGDVGLVTATGFTPSGSTLSGLPQTMGPTRG